MTLKDVFDIFKFRLRLEHQKRGMVRQIDLSPREIAYLLSMAQQDIQRRLNIIQSYSLITLADGTNSYALPSNFGVFKSASINNCALIYDSFDAIVKRAYRKALPTTCNVFYDEEGEKKIIVYPTPNAVGTMRVYYYIDPNFFKASLLSFAESGGISA